MSSRAIDIVNVMQKHIHFRDNPNSAVIVLPIQGDIAGVLPCFFKILFD